MDSFELNKILGAVLGTCLFLMALNIGAGAVFSPEKPAKPGFDIVVPETKPSGGQPQKPPQDPPLADLVANANVERGQKSAQKCAACHTFAKDGKNGIGPDLWGVVGRPRASEPGFNYSAAMKAKGGTWTPDELYRFLKSPREYIPGTAMTFIGLPRPSERADVIAYLNTLTDNPQPLKAEAAPTDNKSAGDDKNDNNKGDNKSAGGDSGGGAH
jgi:cytochrome c